MPDRTQDRGVSFIISNSKTDASTLDYDFSILVLSAPVSLRNSSVGAVCLPKVSDVMATCRSLVLKPMHPAAIADIKLHVVVCGHGYIFQNFKKC